jgi:hypothetical protein
MFASEVLKFIPGSAVGRVVLEYLFYLAIGGYLITGAPGLVRWAFQGGGPRRF